jgi:hypothetical protein
VRSPFVVFKIAFLLAFATLLPATVAWIFFGRTGAIAAVSLISFGLVVDAFRSHRYLARTLRPRIVEVGDYAVYAIEDPSSHAFATYALFAREPKLWITRGALSLLSPEEIKKLLDGMRRAARMGGLRFETVLTSWIMRISSRIPTGIREVLFFRQKRTKSILVRESARGVVWASLILLLDRFYFSTSTGNPGVPEEILRKLEAESRRCVPHLPAALSSHSAVSPWPDAFLTLGRPCLLPMRAVNQKA